MKLIFFYFLAGLYLIYKSSLAACTPTGEDEISPFPSCHSHYESQIAADIRLFSIDKPIFRNLDPDDFLDHLVDKDSTLLV